MNNTKAAFTCLLWLLPALVASEIAPMASSDFEMSLTPVTSRVESSATNKLEHAIRTSLFQSTSVAKGFESVFDIDVVMQKIQWRNSFDTVIVQFEVYATFLSDDSDQQSSIPSRFALDSLIARTFSQPSTKSAFLAQLGLSKEIALMAIEEVFIQLAESDEIPENSNSEATRSLSSLDIILITASACIFLGILFVISTQQRDLDHFGGRQRGLSATKPPANQGSGADQNSSSNQAQNEETAEPPVGGLIQAQDTLDPDTNIGVPFDGGFSDDDKTDASAVGDFDDIESPPLSPYSSVPSSSSDQTSDGSLPSSLPSSPITAANTTAYLLGAPPPNYPNDSFSSAELSPLTARLLRLPAMNSGGSCRPRFPFGSSSSAPGKLMVLPLSPKSTTTSENCEKSVRSSRSASEMHGWLALVQPNLETCSTRSSSNITDLAVISEQSVLASCSEEFDRNWQDLEKRAKEDDEDSSIGDIFNVDVDHQSRVEDGQSRMSEISAVSDWMKSIRVVDGSTDTRSSDMSNSSSEHSSIEPKSGEMRDNNSVDCSLERSLATSIVGV